MPKNTWTSSPVSGSVSGDIRRAWLLEVASPVPCQMSFGVSAHRLCVQEERSGTVQPPSWPAGDVISTGRHMVVVIFSPSSSRGLQGWKSLQGVQVMKPGSLGTSDWHFTDVVKQRSITNKGLMIFRWVVSFSMCSFSLS